MDFSSSNFQIIQPDISETWLNIGIAGIAVFGIGTIVLVVSGIFNMTLGYDDDDLSLGKKLIAFAVPTAILLTLSISLVIAHNTHSDTAKHQTLVNISKWAEAKYPIRVDISQAEDLATPDNEWSWSPSELADAANVDTIGSADVANVDGSKVSKVLLIKVNDEWRIVQYGEGPQYTELKKR